MAYRVELEFAALTDTGRVRAHNEDSIAVSTECGLALLADGMGGYSAGEVASNIATSVLKESLEEQLQNQKWDTRFNRSRRVHQLMLDAIAHTNRSIIEAARLEPTFSGMGTTLVAAFFHHDKVTLAHVGDSRAYRIRHNDITQLTRDHSLLQEQIDAGLISAEDAQFSQNRNLITRAMGVDHDVEVDISDYPIQEGDIYLLCSDGLSDMLSDTEIMVAISKIPLNIKEATEQLVKKANDSGGRDNISVILVKIGHQEQQATSLSDRMLKWINH